MILVYSVQSWVLSTFALCVDCWTIHLSMSPPIHLSVYVYVEELWKHIHSGHLWTQRCRAKPFIIPILGLLIGGAAQFGGLFGGEFYVGYGQGADIL